MPPYKSSAVRASHHIITSVLLTHGLYQHLDIYFTFCVVVFPVMQIPKYPRQRHSKRSGMSCCAGCTSQTRVRSARNWTRARLEKILHVFVKI